MHGLCAGLTGLMICGFTSLAFGQEGAAPASASDAQSASGRAPAEAPSVNLPPQRETLPAGERRWYGWQALAVDGAATTLALGALAFEASDTSPYQNMSGGLIVAGMIGYVTGAPTLHLVHGQPWHALGSFGLRGGLPLLGGALGLAMATCPPPDGEYGNCGLGELLIGASVGAVVAMVIDDAVIAWDRPRRDAHHRARLGLAPVFSREGVRELRAYGTF